MGFNDVVEKFEEEEIILDLLLDLSEKDLVDIFKEMNLKLGK